MLYNKNYTSKRPFLIITNSFKPQRGQLTHKPNWAENGGWEIHEQAQIVDRVTNKHLSTGSVIIDVMEAKVIKTGIPGQSREDIMTHFMTKYRKELTEAIDVWMTKLAREKAVVDFKNPLRQEEVAENTEEAVEVQSTAK